MVLNKEIELSSLDRQIILQQIKASHEGVSNHPKGQQEAVDILDNYEPIERIEIKIKPRTKHHGLIKNSFTDKKNIDSDQISSITPERTGIWGKIRSIVANYLGTNGDAIDKSWISKLEAKIDEEKKTMELIAPSNFACDYISNNYESVLIQSAREQGIVLESIRT